MTTKGKFVDCTQDRLLECHLFIVSISSSQGGLIEAYRAAKKSLEKQADLDKVIAACKARKAYLLTIENE